MIQEDRKLLLKDLCARLPYKPKVKILSLWNENKEVEDNVVDSVYCVMPDGYINTETIDSDISLDNIVLYLRPMSSMTEKEKNEWMEITHAQEWLIIGNLDKATDWLNEHQFDYRGLIPKGLALEAPEGMYNW